MKFNIIADSCCDVTPELKERLGITIVPLTLTLGEEHFIDDETLSMTNFMSEMKSCTAKIGSAAPSPILFKEAFEQSQSSFAITLSSNLSATYSNAMLGKELATEKQNMDIHVFNSKSASAGELLIALELKKMLEEGLDKLKIITHIDKFIDEMKTYFVLNDISNLMKSGRLHKLTGKLISVLNIKPIMGGDKDGNIVQYDLARGNNQIIDKLMKIIEKSGKNTKDKNIVITHCNNAAFAEKLQHAIQALYSFKEILVVPTRGLSSIYANNGGVVMAF